MRFVNNINNSFDKILFNDQDTNFGKDELSYWKGHIFSIITILFIIFGAPVFFYGAYLFCVDGNYAMAISELLIYFSNVVVTTRKSLSVWFRKLYIIITLYLISVLVLIFTGVMGGGMVCVLFTLILTGCLLDKRQAFVVVAVNLLVFTAMTLLLMLGFFDGVLLGQFKRVWYINVITTQVCGIILLFLMNAIYGGLENQTSLLKKSRESLAASEGKHKAMIANISDVIAILDESFKYVYCSPNMEQRYSGKMEGLNGKQIFDNIHPEDRSWVEKELHKILERDGSEKMMEVRFLYREGGVRYVELTAVNLTKDDNIKGILVNFHDITERKIREEEILYLNYHDSLTGLYNRTFFEKEKERLDKEGNLPLSIIIGDINGLKIINDALGHAEGDKLLVEIAKILKSCCKQSDIISRTGGDEFSILLPETSSEAAYDIIRRINSVCEKYNKKVSSDIYYTSISLGYATKADADDSIGKVLKTAEDYMYRRKLLEARSLHSSIISSMKTVLFEKSQETEEHAQRLVKLSKEVGQALGLTNQQFVELELLSTLHDIGKIAIDDHILNKPDKLSGAEWVEMKKHSEIGYRIAMSSPELISIADYILTHHERWDGTGYPQGLAEENIPLISRILSIADAYDAMTEDRPYRKGMSQQDAIAEIVKNAGTQFDPKIAGIFVDIISKQVPG